MKAKSHLIFALIGFNFSLSAISQPTDQSRTANLDRTTFVAAIADRVRRQEGKIADGFLIIQMASELADGGGAGDVDDIYRRNNGARDELHRHVRTLSNREEAEPTTELNALKATWRILADASNGAAGVHPISGAAFGTVTSVGDQALRELERQSRHSQSLNAPVALSSTKRFVAARLEVAAAFLWDRSESDPSLRAKLNEYLPALLGVSIGDSYKETLKNNPDFANSQNVDHLLNMVRQIESGQISKNEFETLLITALVPLYDTIDEQKISVDHLLTIFNDMQKTQGAQALDASRNQLKRLEAERDQLRFETKIAAAQSGLTLVTMFVGAEDPVLARRMDAVGDAGIQMAVSLNHLQDRLGAIKEFGDISGGQGMSALIFAGDVVSIGLALFGAFSDPGPSPEQIILDQITALREDLVEVQRSVLNRIDYLDERISILIRVSADAFDRIDHKLNLLDQDLQVLSRVAARIESSLYMRSELLREMIVEGNDSEIREWWKTTIQVRRDSPDFQITEKTYIDAAAAFFEDAYERSNSISAFSDNPVNADLSDNAELADLLSNKPIDLKLPLLARALYAKSAIEDFKRFSTLKSVSNPAILTRGATHHIELGLSWPEYRRTRPGTIAEVHQMLNRIDVIDELVLAVTRDEEGKARPRVFQSLLESYEQSAKALAPAIIASQSRYEKQHGLEGYDLFAGMDSPVPVRAIPKFINLKDGVDIKDSDVFWDTFDPKKDRDNNDRWEREVIPFEGQAVLPAAILSGIPKEYVMATHLGLGEFLMSCDGIAWEDDGYRDDWYATADDWKHSRKIDGRPDKKHSRIQFRMDRHYEAKLVVGIDVTFKFTAGSRKGDRVQVLNQKYRMKDAIAHRVEACPQLWLKDRWVNHYLHTVTMAKNEYGEPVTFANMMRRVDPKDFESFGDHTKGAEADLNDVRKMVSERLSEWRKGLGNHLAVRFSGKQGGTLSEVASALHADSLLLLDAAQVGLPTALELEPKIAAVFFGHNGLVGQVDLIRLAYEADSAQAITDAAIASSERLSELLIDEYMSRDPLPPERFTNLEHLRRRLNAYLRLLELDHNDSN